jgi:membrane fusion protein, multidrug efflux system
VKKKNIWYYAGITLLAFAVAWWLFIERDSDQVPQGVAPKGAAAPVAVEIAPVERGPLVQIQTFTGTLRPGAQFDLSTQIAGRLDDLKVDLGDTVGQGQVVALLDDDKYRFELEQAKAELEVARANLAEAESSLAIRRREYERAEQLRKQRVASEAELDSARAEYQAQQARVRVASAQVAQKQAALMGAELMLSYTIIRADWQDNDHIRVVGERYTDEGTYLPANTPIVSIVKIDTLTAVAYVSERDYPRLSVGRHVDVTVDAVPDRVFSGRLARLAPVVREASRQARMEIAVDNPDMILKPGMFVRLEIEMDRSDDARIVPRTALVERPGLRALYMADLETGSARYVTVETGVETRDLVEIRHPPLDGFVVTLGQHLLSDGAPILVSGGHEADGTEQDDAAHSDRPGGGPSR